MATEKKKVGNVNMLTWILDNKSLLLLVVIAILAQILSGGIFFRWDNISSVMRQVSITCILSMGYVFVLTNGMIDLSVGHMLSLCGVVYSQMALIAPLPVAILVTIIAGIICGLFNGLVCIKFNLLPFVLTLGSAQMFRGIAYLLCNGISINITDPAMKFIGQGIVLGFIPMPVVIVAILTVIVAIIVYRTKLGIHTMATGGNSEAARVSGVNVARTKITGFVIMGITVSIAALVLIGRVAIAMPNGGQGLEMDAISATIIGGTALSGGKPNVVGAIFGSLILGVISNLLNLAHLNSFWQWFFKGVIIIAAILLDSLSEKIFKKRQLS